MVKWSLEAGGGEGARRSEAAVLFALVRNMRHRILNTTPKTPSNISQILFFLPVPVSVAGL